MEIDNDFANRTCGLCGDFSGSPLNEFIENGVYGRLGLSIGEKLFVTT